MTQVELPQLSLQRYVDLVRRRRWQLLPVSLLGLLVGGIVAFAIPRYYVAETSFEHEKIQGEFDAKIEDPFRRIVNTAQQTIPLAAGKAMETLKWPEALVADPSERTLFEKEVRSRIVVIDSNQAEKDRAIAHIRIFYRDQNGARAAALANALFDTWSQERVALLRSSHEKGLERANQDFTAADKTFDRLLQEKQDLELQYRLHADRDPREEQQETSERKQKQQELRDTLWSKENDLATLTVEIARQQEKLRTMPERVAPNLSDLLSAAVGNPPVMQMVLQLQLSKATIDELAEGTRNRASAERAIKSQEQMIVTMLAIDIDANGLVRNREYAALAMQLANDAKAVAKLEIEIKRLQKEVADQKRQFDDMAEGRRRYALNKKALASAEVARKDAEERQKTQNGILAALEQRLPVQQLQRALPPPHPTEPNILVVALIGAVLGLGVAIGLILLLDMLQGSFKTSDDVERGLGVPVLGGISHLETEEERLSLARGRRRAATASFSFVALVVVVVTIYYRAPTRLPAVVRDLLTMLLGS